MMFVLTTIKHEPNKILDDPLRRWLSCLNMSAVLHTPLPDTCSCPPPSLAIHVCISCLIQFRLTSPPPQPGSTVTTLLWRVTAGCGDTVQGHLSTVTDLVQEEMRL